MISCYVSSVLFEVLSAGKLRLVALVILIKICQLVFVENNENMVTIFFNSKQIATMISFNKSRKTCINF